MEMLYAGRPYQKCRRQLNLINSRAAASSVTGHKLALTALPVALTVRDPDRSQKMTVVVKENGEAKTVGWRFKRGRRVANL